MTLKKNAVIAITMARVDERTFLAVHHLASVVRGATAIPAAGGVATAEIRTTDGHAEEALA